MTRPSSTAQWPPGLWPPPHRDLQVVLPGERHRGGDVVGVDAAGDHTRAAIDQQVEAEARLVVLGVARREHVALQGFPERLHICIYRRSEPSVIIGMRSNLGIDGEKGRDADGVGCGAGAARRR
jgi:hypothetical protein